MSNYLVTYGKPRFLGIVSLDDELYDRIRKDRLIVALSHRGEEMAEVVGPLTEEQEAEYRSMKTISEHGEGPVRGGDPVVTDLRFMRLPTDQDFEEMDEQAANNAETMQIAQELIESHELDVKLVDSEMLLGGKKLFFYFTAEQRVDFRTLVKDLARRFRTRIELRQMGVRDEARIIKGLASCGLPCCCSYWLNKLTPIGIKKVKEQNIALNPAKISGICGRLMCCMSFEHKTYKDMWNGLPGPGSKIKTPNGNYIVVAVDLAREGVRCHKPTGGDIIVPLPLFTDFRDAVMRGEEWEVPEDAVSEYDKRKGRCAGCMKDSAIDDFDFSEFERRGASTEPRERTQERPHDQLGRPKRKRGRGGRRDDRDGHEMPREQGAQQPRQQSRDVTPHQADGQPHHKKPKRRRRRPSGGDMHGGARGEI